MAQFQPGPVVLIEPRRLTDLLLLPQDRTAAAAMLVVRCLRWRRAMLRREERGYEYYDVEFRPGCGLTRGDLLGLSLAKQRILLAVVRFYALFFSFSSPLG